MAWLRVRLGSGNNCKVIQMPSPLEFAMEGDRLVIKGTADDGKEHVFMLWGTETEDLRNFLLGK